MTRSKSNLIARCSIPNRPTALAIFRIRSTQYRGGDYLPMMIVCNHSRRSINIANTHSYDSYDDHATHGRWLRRRWLRGSLFGEHPIEHTHRTSRGPQLETQLETQHPKSRKITRSVETPFSAKEPERWIRLVDRSRVKNGPAPWRIEPHFSRLIHSN